MINLVGAACLLLSLCFISILPASSSRYSGSPPRWSGSGNITGARMLPVSFTLTSAPKPVSETVA